MSGYERVIEALEAGNLDWNEVDRIMLQEEAYEDFFERASFAPANHATTDKPAIRQTDGEEKLVYVDKNGYEVEVLL